MWSVPRDGYRAQSVRFFCEPVPISVTRWWPEPTGKHRCLFRHLCRLSALLVVPEIGDEVSSEPVLVRALPSSRFGGTFVKSVVLDSRKANCLEDLETELRNLGFVSKFARLIQLSSEPNKFRVETDERVDARLGGNHAGVPLGVEKVAERSITRSDLFNHAGLQTVNPRSPLVLNRRRSRPAF